MEDKTIFEKIIDKEIESTLLYEDDQVIAIEDINPVAPTHILIIPKKKIATINEIGTEERPSIGHMVFIARNIAKEAGIDESGYRLVFNTNEDLSLIHI